MDNLFEETTEDENKLDNVTNFVEKYQELMNLRDDYLSFPHGNKQIKVQIEEIKQELLTLLEQLRDQIITFDDSSDKDKPLNTQERMIEFLLRQANVENDKYSLNKIRVAGLVFSKNSTKTGRVEYIINNVWMIGEKTVITKMDDHYIYDDTEFSKITSKMIENGHSLVLVTDTDFEKNVLPNVDSKLAYQVRINTDDPTINISCYLQQDELKKAVDQLVTFNTQKDEDDFIKVKRKSNKKK